ncbi:UDP-N-acetylmuramoyl-L-alanyl-D-glutamate--2,6-diaminopimelate ligase [Salinicola rhizosphaerae]|uniref:UDP-N-acetylmuramoyl-L-alanyl-D-glutamate--2,6-diaminopimelate ligase n=1 Tax=Salinicola rhizosphaerae TaxID=1443141 RepID=A0ABQ3ECY8_9GAMM|nr:UDP-N-acetylmuramoyl-L-alanyl-D-glutamate--2,6-diaminopimelate ligase [Salinicola rhizosphaerae]GHB31001.1 UDP-N-acetylmuramoyl-L-alanyl-D-glutamate--2,6-diaminopimelate ligase [Salinicola rhizosphaerae]
MRIDGARLRSALSAMWPDAASAERLQHWLPEPPEGASTAQPLTVELVQDSRAVSAGSLFLAVPGVATDGRDFLESAFGAGAVAALCEAEGLEADWQADSRVLALPNLAERLAALGRELFGVPAEMTLIGVTGTNGKSSVTHYIATLLGSLGCRAGVVGTLGYGAPHALQPALQTTPGPLALQQMLGDMAGESIDTVAMEVSSHALAQDRLGDTPITCAVFTNLTRDHLDYHGSMAAYAAAKAKLFKRPELELAVVNGDDPLARLMLAGLEEGVRVLAIGQAAATTLRVVDVEMLPNGLRAIVATPENEGVLELPLMGRFNLDNVLLGMSVLYGLGYPLAEVWSAAGKLTPVAGRMQRLPRAPDARAPIVVIDYAHTPAALESALGALRDHLPARDGGKLWCVFGCGGDRDPGKRPLMAAAVEKWADRIVITDDNPRSESATLIRDAAAGGLSESARAEVWSIEGRRQAIERVIAAAGPADIVLIAGKGHEDYQEIAGVRQPFSDIEVATEILDRQERKR